jgi:hypothetical protein
MNEGRRNILGDFVMSSTIGCAAFIAFVCLCAIIASSIMVILTFLKK